MTTVRISPAAALDIPALKDAVTALDADPTVERVILGDDHVTGQSAVVLAAWLAPQTTRIALVPEVPVTNTEPFHAATTTATLDHLTAFTGPARAGWAPTVQTGEVGRRDAALVGLRPPAEPASAWEHAVDVDTAVSALWGSWDPDAEIRDTVTARFIDRDKVRYTETTGTDAAGETFTVKGPSIVPRSPQGDLTTVITVDGQESLSAASRIADVVVLRRGDGSVTVGEVLEKLGTPDRSDSASPDRYVPVLLEVDASGIVNSGVPELPEGVSGLAVEVDDLSTVRPLLDALASSTTGDTVAGHHR
ncbi:LLM class oxidoreductase [Corynebacterium provencense]|jgi:alkanesulfonate monooxygenase SsuD/methylene tetrahydromethanopterin reductase-like flavin-dependent oxidoreductase (luciferase family)|uniref:Nitrilotriacetate monooxygenase component A n=1 Tax=Corynebacterium provencense TaxID=1737425 RepID=A0A2Z3YYF6_9CORY|nr:LLM class flavin-dependent oxidoreductase [Corynebacterium provencense]AWT27127.1 Nitrilotriacetate monooxygenase component A [Corynebacterium provencense]MCI1255297.1 LLM class flavin-dependent oxidoreductase [Corynebacterium provencense]